MYLINDDIIFNSIDGVLSRLTSDDSELLFEREKKEIKLLAPSSRVLKYLIDNQDSLASQKELFTVGWGDKAKFVTTNAFYQNILLIRRAFKELGYDDAIITIPRKGYRLNECIIHKKIPQNSPESEIKEIKEIKEVSEVSEVKEILNKKQRSEKISINYELIYVLTLFVILFLTFGFVIHSFYNKKNQLYSYKKCSELEGKNIYCNKDDSSFNHNTEFLSNISKDENDKYKYIYFTEANHSTRISYIFCMKKFRFINFGRNECISFYILDRGNI